MHYSVGLYTFFLLGLNIVISFWAFSWIRKGGNPDRFLFSPYSLARGRGADGALLSQFSHADLGHLVFNMLTLYYFGPVVEGYLGGHIFTVYFAAGLVALVIVFLIHRGDAGYRVLGASGSITGILFAAIILNPSMSVYFMFVPVPIPSPIFALLYLAMSTWLMSRGELTRVSHEAHLGGAFTGLILGSLLSPYGFGPLLERFHGLLHR
jgi:membrane associated rhomboid family serine protease